MGRVTTRDKPSGQTSSRSRMTGKQRREQLIEVGRRLFAEKGFEATTVEEIAAKASVSKPVVYEHFGGKEGLYAVVVDREIRTLLDGITSALSAETTSRGLLEAAALSLLDYIEGSTDGFRIMVRDSPAGQSTGSFASLISDVADSRKFKKADVAAHLVNLAWNGLSGLEAKPTVLLMR